MRICKNNLSDILRDSFQANPVKVPESRILPLIILELEKNKPKYIGNIKYLLQGSEEVEFPIHKGLASNVSNTFSKSTDLKAGFKILDGFLKGIGIDPAVVRASIKGNKTISFAFNNVKTQYIDLLEFGKILNTQDLIIDPLNFGINKANGKPPRLALIDRVIQSNNFSMRVFKENDSSGKIDVPLINDHLSDIKTSIKVDKSSEHEIKFSGDSYLTFAFSCIELFLEEETHKVSRGKTLDNIKSGIRKAGSEEGSTFEKMDFDIPLAEPELLEL